MSRIAPGGAEVCQTTGLMGGRLGGKDDQEPVARRRTSIAGNMSFSSSSHGHPGRPFEALSPTRRLSLNELSPQR